MSDESTLPSNRYSGDETIASPGVDAPAIPVAANEWGSFRLIARVGFGGFGEVYRAWDPHLEREVALKLLLTEAGQPGVQAGAQRGASTIAQEDAQYKAMLREARALASVVHPNIVRVYGIDRHDGRVGFWTDFVRGKTLSVLLGSQGAFGYREAAMIGLDVTRALAAVHRAGILHRDIKAENVMREEGGRILLMDFGLSTLPSRQNNIAGTPNYMAPELWEGGQATVLSDIYAMGVLLYLLVAGEYPVRLGGLTPVEVQAALRRRLPLMDVRSDLPESYLRMVATAMELDPAKRYQTAGELAGALTECLGTGGGSLAELANGAGRESGPHRIGAEAAAMPAKPGRRRLLYSAAAGVVVLVGLGVIGSRTDTGRRWLNVATGSATAGVSTSTYDEYLKAQDLLLHSYKASNLVAAAKGFQAILAKDPKFALAEAGLGRVYYVQFLNSSDPKLLDQAKEATQKALDLDPNTSFAYATMARISATSGQIDLASQQVQKALALDPHSADAYGVLAEVDQAAGRNADALNALQKASDLAPDDWHWPIRLGLIALQTGDLKKAAEQLHQAIDLSKDNPVAFSDLGAVEMQTGDLIDAKKHIQTALEIEPSSDGYSNLAAVEMMQGSFDDAAVSYRKAIDLDPKDYDLWRNLASATLWGTGGHEAAVEAYKRSIELGEATRAKTPDDANVVAALAEDYASIGVTDRSIQMIRKALVLAPNDPSIAYQAGESYEIDGQRSKAIPLLAYAIAKGYDLSQFRLSPELAALRADPAFKSALEKAKVAAVAETIGNSSTP